MECIYKSKIEPAKYYIRFQSADTGSAAIVLLTDSEYKTVKRFLDAPKTINEEYDCNGAYSGSCEISDIGFETYDEAVEFAKSHIR